MNAVIYARFSSANQTEASIDAQVRACRAYAAQNGYNIVEIYADEAVSGRTTNRIKYQKMLRDVKKGNFEAILIHKYDRIARNVGDHVNLSIRLKELNVLLIAVAQDFGESKEAKMMKTISWAMSEYYCDNLSEETMKGHQEAALKALHNGGHPPFGYDIKEQRYIINAMEAVFVRKMFDCAADRKGFKALIEEMDAAGIRGKRGKTIKYPQIYEILRNEKYTGVYLYSLTEAKDRSERRNKTGAIRIEHAFPAIIHEGLFERVQDIMKERKQSGKINVYKCSGLVYCGQCGSKMYAQTSHRKGHEYHRYICSNHCGIGCFSIELIDDIVTKYLEELFTPFNRRLIEDSLQRYVSDEKKYIKDFEREKDKRLEVLEKEYQSLMGMLKAGELPAPIFAKVVKELEINIKQTETLEKVQPQRDFSPAIVNQWLDSLLDTNDMMLPSVLVERIDITKTEAKVTSTLASVVGKIGCGGSQHILPTIMSWYVSKLSS